MQQLLEELAASIAAGRRVAWCRLVETRGSTPQKAGAAMLVYADGSQAGTLGGGCVEAEVKRRALAILEAGKAEVVSFQLDSDYGWDDGLICGGRMQVLVVPLRQPRDAAYHQALARQAASGAGCIEAVVFDSARSGLAAPACYLFDATGQLVAADLAARDASPNGHETSGQETLDQESSSAMADEQQAAPSAPPLVLEHLPTLADRPRPYATKGIAYLPILPRTRLLIVGGGHIGQAVGNLAADLDFEVWVLDDRAEFVSAERFPRAARRLHGPIGPTLRDLEITPDTYCLIVTRGHNHDEEALYHLAERQARYVGMIGSRRKIKLIFDDLLAEGVSAEALSKVYAPVGIDIGSQTVAEIAISILAELVAHRNLGGQVPGRPESVAISA